MNRAGTTVSPIRNADADGPILYSAVSYRIQILQKTGQIERTVDREFADEEQKYKTYASLFICLTIPN